MDPFKKFTHGGTLSAAEILFNTRFDYMFRLAAENPECLLPPGATTQGCLLALGTAMANDVIADPLDSTIPAVFTYLGQFIDHDITAQTDREIGISRIATPDGMVMDLTPIPADECARELINGRRPSLDLDQVYGDGPSLGAGAGPTEADRLFDGSKKFKVVNDPPGFDVPRQNDGTAVIADMRNNENLNVSQLHCAFLLFHNKVAAALPAALSNDERYIRARQLVRWAYQYIVVHDYLPIVCEPSVVSDIVSNGLRYYSPDDNVVFMPLEFSVAAFRFAHSMIRPQYKINATTTLPLSQVLTVGGLLAGGPPPKVAAANIIEWHNFAQISGHPAPQRSRKIDPLISMDLGDLPFHLPGATTIPAGPLLQHLARRNLLRGFVLSIPTGQTIAEAMQMKPMTAAELKTGVSPEIISALEGANFDTATPLWYYILQEAKIKHGGNRLGPVGSRIVGETLYGLVERQRASYLNHQDDPAVTATGVEVSAGTVISTIGELLSFAGVPI